MLLHQRQRPELVKYTHKTHNSFINHQSYTALLKIWAACPLRIALILLCAYQISSQSELFNLMMTLDKTLRDSQNYYN